MSVSSKNSVNIIENSTQTNMQIFIFVKDMMVDHIGNEDPAFNILNFPNIIISAIILNMFS